MGLSLGGSFGPIRASIPLSGGGGRRRPPNRPPDGVDRAVAMAFLLGFPGVLLYSCGGWRLVIIVGAVLAALIIAFVVLVVIPVHREDKAEAEAATRRHR